MNVTQEAVGTFSRPQPFICTLKDCLEAAAEYFKHEPAELLSHDVWQPLSRRRLLMIYIMRTSGGFSFPQIARFVGRDNSTIQRACRVMEAKLPCDQNLARDHAAILEIMQRP